MYAPGVVGIAVALIVLLFMKGSPEEFGHAPIASPKPKQNAASTGLPP